MRGMGQHVALRAGICQSRHPERGILSQLQAFAVIAAPKICGARQVAQYFRAWPMICAAIAVAAAPPAAAEEPNAQLHASYAPPLPGSSPFPEPADPDEPLPTDIEAAFLVDASLSVTSDYRDRGLSLSNRNPALQGEVTVTHRRSGLFATAFASTVAEDGGADTEIAATLGITRPIGRWTVGVGITGTFYPGDPGTASYEVQAVAERPIGQGKWGVELAYSPEQANLGGEDNIYLGTFAEMPIGDLPLSIYGTIGVEHGEGGNRKIDWSVGTEVELGNFALDLSYIDTARAGAEPGSDATLVASISHNF
jgi:uncharacterized protein (TIGR02001 family)